VRESECASDEGDAAVTADDKLTPFFDAYEEGYNAGFEEGKKEDTARVNKLLMALKLISSMSSPMGFAGCPAVAEQALQEWKESNKK
jgi:flagellar biosynthesis/type III secretory pathway protein FliH